MRFRFEDVVLVVLIGLVLGVLYVLVTVRLPLFGTS